MAFPSSSGVAACRAALAAKGFDICHVMAVSWYNDLFREGAALAGNARCRPLPTFSHDGDGDGKDCLALLVGNTKALWPKFCEHARSTAADLQESDPLDAYTERAVADAAAAAFGGGTGTSTGTGASAACCKHAIFYGHDGARLVAMQRAAHAAGFAHYDTATTHLCLHPTYGAWFALRAIVVCDRAVARAPAAAPPPLDAVLPEADRAKCVAAYQRAIAPREDGDSTNHWLSMRDAAMPKSSPGFVGGERGLHPYRYPATMLKYHYDHPWAEQGVPPLVWLRAHLEANHGLI